MYQVIARKYRPQAFHDVVNQEHVKTTLENAIAQNRIAHGYIFSGQRGTGKTTVARIVARCLNCVEGPTTTPCGECASCREITGGGTVDVIEIDAASNRGINEMRELRENVRYRPSRDRYKVFIVDEAHQITTDAFNALLKTLEEPPEWVVFILCTTESHKIPATIASRCQHFSFRGVDFDDLIARMAWICQQEGVEADPDALTVLAHAGGGSVRDSLSALDQAIACCGSKLDPAGVRALLGAFSIESLETVTNALAAGDSAAMLQTVDELERNGHNLQHFSREVCRYFRNLLIARVAGAETRLIAASAGQRTRLAEIAAQFSEEDLSRYLQLSLELFQELERSLQPRFHLEMGLVRLVHAGRLRPIEEALAKLQGGAAPRNEPAAPRSEPGTARPAPVAAPPRPARTGPSPFEMDRMKKAVRPEPQGMSHAPVAGTAALAPAPAREPEPAPAPAAAPVVEMPPAALPEGDADWRARLHAAAIELGMPFTADAIERASVVENNNQLTITAPPDCKLALGQADAEKIAKQAAGRTMRVTRVFAQVAAAGPALAAPRRGNDAEEEARQRAMEHPQVQRFVELFGGDIRQVRNLKE